jgi:hypothetical protein
MKPKIYGIIFSSVIVVGGLKAGAQITVDGTLDPAYGSPLATQTINTGFGDSTIGDGTSAGGSELDAAYAKVQGGYLYLFLAGNLEDNGNNINIFFSDGRAGQSVLNAPALNGTFDNDMSAMNGSKFSPGFSATFGLDLNYFSGNIYGGPFTVNSYNLINGVFGSGGYITPTSGIGSANFNGILVGVNDRNRGGVNGNTGTAANPAAADAVDRGFEFGIPLSLLGNPTGNIKILADINGTSDDYLSQQFLPGLPVGTGDLGAGGPYSAVPVSAGYAGFNFSSTPGEYFTVVIPEPSTVAAGAAGALLALGIVFVPRHRKGQNLSFSK